jgi:hypothetical protein
MPQVFSREQRGKDRDDQRFQTPLQNNLVDHEEREEIDEFGPEIHCIEDTPPFPHLMQSTYEESLMSAQIHELGKEKRAGHTFNIYNLRSRRKEGDFDSPDQPLIADMPTKNAAAMAKEKKTQSVSPTAKEPVTDVREASKPIPSFNFEHEIHKIRIPVPLSELVKNEDFKRSPSKLLQFVRKTGPRSNKIKQMQKQNTEDTQYKRDTDLRGSPSVGYVHQRNCQVLPLLLSSK